MSCGSASISIILINQESANERCPLDGDLCRNFTSAAIFLNTYVLLLCLCLKGQFYAVLRKLKKIIYIVISVFFSKHSSKQC